MAARRNIFEGRTDRSSVKFYGILAGVGIVLVGGAYFVGTSDTGEINVAATIQESNFTSGSGGAQGSQNVPTVPEAFRNMPNGGLVPQGGTPEPAPEPLPEVSEETSATTTEEGEEAEAPEESA